MHLTAMTGTPGAPLDDNSVQLVVNRLLMHFSLSKRETEATVLLAQGLRAKEIAHQMCCSEKTVYAHLARVCKKTGRRDQHELVCVLLAFACNLLDASAEPRAPGLPGSGPETACYRDMVASRPARTGE